MVETLWLVTLATRCLAIGVLVRSLEVLASWREWPEDRLLGWTRAGARRAGHLALVESTLSKDAAALGILTTRAVVAAVCAYVEFTSPVMPWLLAYLVVAQAYYNRRFLVIIQGADTMFLVGLAAMCAASLDPDDAALRAIALAFLGLQVQLAYFTAGLIKLRAPSWRDGRRLIAIVESGSHRVGSLERLLGNRPRLAIAASWSIILFELLFPLSPLLPTPVVHVALAIGVGFHLSIAVLMGLHTFFWSFVAAYPGVYFVHQWLH